MIKRFKLPSNQSYSSLLLEPIVTKSRPRLPTLNKVNNNNKSNLHLSILETPARRCFLTSKVLPNAYLIKFVLAGPSNERILIPTGILHPRFEKKLSGKGAWIICREDAVDLMSRKGSYKRLSTNSILPSTIKEKIKSQLSRRINQEIILLSERIKSQSKNYFDERIQEFRMRECIIRQLSVLEWKDIIECRETGMMILKRDGMKLVAVISLAPTSNSDSTSTNKIPLCQFFPSAPDTTTSNPIPFYNLHSFLSSVTLPPSFNSSSSSSSSSIPTPIIEEIKSTLTKTINLFERRTLVETTTTKANPIVASDYYAIYSPLPIAFKLDDQISTTSDTTSKSATDLIPLLMALWRCTLWNGEGWESKGER